jgi:hypothetical protein
MQILRLTLCLLLLAPVCVFADSMAPAQSKQTFSSDHKLVFVSLIPYSYSRNELNDKYPRSGLYRVDDPRNPVWAYEGGGDVEVSTDSKHAVFWGPWANLGDGGTTDALYFVREGKLVRTYQIKDLVKGPMPRSVSHYRWCKTSRFDDIDRTFLVTVYAGPDGSAGPTYVFDLATGNIIARHIPFSQRVPLPFWVWSVLFVGGLILIGVITAALVNHPRRRSGNSAIVIVD